MSNLSRIGPEILFLYSTAHLGDLAHCFSGNPKYPHLQGFIAAMSWIFAGYVICSLAREMVISFVSNGWRKASITER